jgi:D-alanine-D-alanine ligase-like ATP-grasp enzyme
MAKNTKKKNIIIYVMTLRDTYLDALKEYTKKQNKSYRVMLLWDSKLKLPIDKQDYDFVVQCDFSKPWKIAEALLPYQDELLAITCRTEHNIARFAQVIPHVPYLRTPSTASLLWSTDKYEMRKRLRLFDAKNTPVFTWVKDNSKSERARVIEKVKFPMIIKPASLAGSLFVTICYHEEELEKALRTMFRKLKQAYKADNRKEIPKIIAEEYMEGDLYSLDTYVNSRGQTYHCPMVRQKTARDIGHDDFYNYLQITPAALKKTTVEAAHTVTETAIKALGLRSSTVHTELMKVDDEWKVIEIGPRSGGFRDVLYKLSCDINHVMNDIAIRIPRKPVVPKKCQGHAAVLKWFAAKEGKIIEMKGIKKIEGLESFHRITIKKKLGDRAIFARNGGRSVFDLFLYNTARSKLLADIRRVEKLVSIKVADRHASQRTSKTKPVSNTTKNKTTRKKR